MRRFTQLYLEIDRTTRTAEKTAAMERYFREAPPRDAAWAVFFLSGRRVNRAVSGPVLHECLRRETGLPDWLIAECYEAVGDFSETISLLLQETAAGDESAVAEPLHVTAETRIVPLAAADDAERERIIRAAWASLPGMQRFVYQKLISGTFRVGVQRPLVARALAAAAGLEPAVIAHRLAGAFEPTEAAYAALVGGAGATDDARPYPFYLARQLDDPPESLGDIADWQAEWKWDGMRVQLIRRGGAALAWSRGEELVTDQFPGVRESVRALEPGAVIDAELLAWDASAQRARFFSDLQKLRGKTAGRGQAMLFAAPEAMLIAYDLLEADGEDVRSRAMSERRALLEGVVAGARQRGAAIMLSPLVEAASWEAIHAARAAARDERGAEGIMLKHRASPYGVGRTGSGKSGWWKWKVDPYSVDAVLIYAQPGSGKRASLYSDYTFGLWEGEGADRRLVPFAKAYSGLDDAEIAEVDRFVRRNALERKGPVRIVKPELVFEIGFEGIAASGRHKAGIAVRFPRMLRWRHDKKADDADTMETLRGLLRSAGWDRSPERSGGGRSPDRPRPKPPGPS